MKQNEKSNLDLLNEIENLKVELGELKETCLKTKNAHDYLLNEQKTFLSLTDSVPYGIYRIKVFSTVKTSEEQWKNTEEAPFKVLFINDRFCSILNIKKEDFIKNPGLIFKKIYEEDIADFAKKNAEANPNLPFLWEGRFIVEGKIIWAHFESTPEKEENGDVIWTGILYEITSRIEAEQEINEINRELKKMNAEKDKFFSIIAHDLKSPFNSILGFSELLVEKIKIGNPEGIKQYSEIIFNSAQKANNLLTNLMEWLQLQTGRLKVFPEYFEVNIEINNVTQLYNDIANQKSINIYKNIPKTIIAYGDKQMINTVLRNLISNAVKFTENGGDINISAKILNGHILFSISDTGIGIPSSVKNKLFTTEENISTLGTQNEMGTGLGLLLCKELIEKNEGKIWVESEESVGSQFYFTIPIK